MPAASDVLDRKPEETVDRLGSVHPFPGVFAKAQLAVGVVAEGEEPTRVGQHEAVSGARSDLDHVERAEGANHPTVKLSQFSIFVQLRIFCKFILRDGYAITACIMPRLTFAVAPIQ